MAVAVAVGIGHWRWEGFGEHHSSEWCRQWIRAAAVKHVCNFNPGRVAIYWQTGTLPLVVCLTATPN